MCGLKLPLRGEPEALGKAILGAAAGLFRFALGKVQGSDCRLKSRWSVEAARIKGEISVVFGGDEACPGGALGGIKAGRIR